MHLHNARKTHQCRKKASEAQASEALEAENKCQTHKGMQITGRHSLYPLAATITRTLRSITITSAVSEYSKTEVVDFKQPRSFLLMLDNINDAPYGGNLFFRQSGNICNPFTFNSEEIVCCYMKHLCNTD